MNDLQFERSLSNPQLRQELDATARRERARNLTRFLSQSAEALLGRSIGDSERQQLCPACG